MFEVKATDLGARLGKLRTKSGVLETPALLPVIHPAKQLIHPSELKEMGFQAVMTNAYITFKHHGSLASEKGIHRVIGFDGVVMTDSGGYQVLEYGSVDIDPSEMARFEEAIGTDIAIVLDRPTGFRVPRHHAEATVTETLKAARITIKERKRRDILWAGAIQGGRFLDLVERSTKELSSLGFDLLALGSPTEMMKEYDYSLLLRMILAAKSSMPLEKPLHLFGAGHPLTIAVAAALGCDLFDSASYILYAKDGRYLTDGATLKLEQLSFLPCSCPVCTRYNAEELRKEEEQRVRLIAIHNLYQLAKEVKAVKQAIAEGRLWELIMAKAHQHPKLREALHIFSSLVDYFEDGTPVFKQRALLFVSPEDQWRPEVIRHRRRLLTDVRVPSDKEVLLITPELESKPLYETRLYKRLKNLLKDDIMKKLELCLLSKPIGLIPLEISDVYPLSQHLGSKNVEYDVKALIGHVVDFVKINKFKKVILLDISKDHHSLMKELKEALNELATVLREVDEASIIETVNV